jgi:hypothetical protein
MDDLASKHVTSGIYLTSTEWADDYNKRNNPFTGRIDTVKVEQK